MDTREALAPPEASALFDRIWADHLRQAVEEAPKCSIESVFERLWDSAKSWVKRSANHREFRVANCLCLRAPRRRGEDLGAWYARCPLRPIVFEDPGLTDLGEPTPGADRESLIEPVHMHLEHRISQRLLGRFMSQGFMYNDLSIRELKVHLEKKAIDLETMVRKELGRAGEKEAENTRKLLEEQDKRIDKTLADREREEAIAKAKANEREARAGPTLFDVEEEAKPLYDERARRECALRKAGDGEAQERHRARNPGRARPNSRPIRRADRAAGTGRDRLSLA